LDASLPTGKPRNGTPGPLSKDPGFETHRKDLVMMETFGATSTTDDVLAGMDLRGKRVLVTGVSAGLGVETARALVAHGAHVTGAARDLAKAERATDQVRAAAGGAGPFEHA
jgi:hypothetical protein